jgi:putative membrane protein
MRIIALAPFLVIALWQCTREKEVKNDVVDSTSTLINNFIQSTTNASKVAIELNELASQSNNTQIRSFADSGANYYSGFLREIQDLAVANNVKLPDSLALVEVLAIKELEIKKGLDFDKSFVRMMIVAQQIIASEFRKVSKIKNEKVRQILTSRFPELKKEMNNLRNIRNELLRQPDNNASKRKEKTA